MAASYTCDGCGCSVASPKKIGHVLQLDYCETCAPKAEGFLLAEEALREACYSTFIQGRQVLIDSSSQGGFKLPDVP